MTLKLNRAALLLPRVETMIDWYFGEKINAAIGPLGALHARKRALAKDAADNPLIGSADDRAAILARAAEQDAAIAKLDSERRAMKAKARAATSAAELQAILADIERLATSDI